MFREYSVTDHVDRTDEAEGLISLKGKTGSQIMISFNNLRIKALISNLDAPHHSVGDWPTAG